MRLKAVVLLCLVALFVSVEAPASTERRVALVIGNGDYKTSPLKNPVNDARDMAAALRRLGFTVITRENASLRQMEEGIREFWDTLRKGGTGLFFYAGHGVQVGGDNYLVPVDAKLEVEKDTRFECVDAGKILARMEDAGNHLNIVILDACRNNPFARKFRSSDRGLARMDAPAGSILAYATAPGAVAADGETRNGLYTSHLLRTIQTPGLPVEQVFKRVRDAVMRDTYNKQVPWESTSLRGDFFFIPPAGAAANTSMPAPQAPKAVEQAEPRKERTLGDIFASLFKKQEPAPGLTLAPGMELAPAAPQAAQQPSPPQPAAEQHVQAPAPRPSQEKVDLNELRRKAETEAKAEAELRKEWASWQSRLRKDMASAQTLEREKVVPAHIKAEAWNKLATTYAMDNPYTDEDDRLRVKIAAQAELWTSRAGPQAPQEKPRAVDTAQPAQGSQPVAATPQAPQIQESAPQTVALAPAQVGPEQPKQVEQPKKEWTLAGFFKSLFGAKDDPQPQLYAATRSLPQQELAPDPDPKAAKCPELSKKQWEAVMKLMRSDFAKAQKFEKRKSVEPQEKAAVWGALLTEHACDNPFSKDDDKLRSQMQGREEFWASKR